MRGDPLTVTSSTIEDMLKVVVAEPKIVIVSESATTTSLGWQEL